MSRYQVTVHFGAYIDEDGAIGYDKPLRTFFLQGFIQEDEPDNGLEIWLGGDLEECPTLADMLEMAKKRGYSVSGLKNEAVVSMLAEASERPTVSLGERLGIIR